VFHLSPSQRGQLRARLEERARTLRREIAEALHGDETGAALGVAERRSETGDEAVEDLEAGIEAAGAERDAAELNAVLEALVRMDAGHYGTCIDCGAPLALERLLAQPHALRCVRCETERERLRAQPSLPAL